MRFRAVAAVLRPLSGGIVVLAVVSATAWFALDRGRDQDASSDSQLKPVTAPVERRTLRDVVRLHGSVAGRPLPKLLANGEGRVTRMSVSPGQVVNHGDKLIDIDGEPVVAIDGEFPYWRSVGPAVEGADVLQLETALVTSGYMPGSVDERFTNVTGQAVRAWQRDHGLPEDGILHPDRVLVASWPARIVRVGVELGAFVAPEKELFEISTTEPVGSFSVTTAERSHLTVGQKVTGTVGDEQSEPWSGVLTDISSVPIHDEETNEDRYKLVVEFDDEPRLTDGESIRGEIVIAEATDALAIPILAVRSDANGDPSVTVDEGGRRRQVNIALGLQEAGYVEVASGLEGQEQVVVELG